MPRPFDVALREHRVVPERRLCLPPRRGECVAELGRGANDAHPAPASPRCGLQDQRVAELLRLARLDHRNTGLAGDPLRLELVAGRFERSGRRPDPDEPGRLDGPCEVRVLGEEAVARVDRVGTGRCGGANVLPGVEVRGDLDGLVGRARVQRALVVRRSDRDGGDSELTACPKDAQRNFAAVRDQQLRDAAQADPRQTRTSRAIAAAPATASTTRLTTSAAVSARGDGRERPAERFTPSSQPTASETAPVMNWFRLSWSRSA